MNLCMAVQICCCRGFVTSITFTGETLSDCHIKNSGALYIRYDTYLTSLGKRFGFVESLCIVKQTSGIFIACLVHSQG